MTKKIILCFLFFVISPLVISFSLYFISFQNQGRILGKSTVDNYSNFYAALPEETGIIAYTLKIEDSTPLIIEKYLKHFNSPLLPYADLIVKSSVKSGVNPKLIVAIAQQESNLGKNSPLDCFNAWGWGIHARGTKCYESWEESIQNVIDGIAKKYCAKGYCDDPCVMMKKYTPNSNGSWCFGVNQFLREMELGDF